MINFEDKFQKTDSFLQKNVNQNLNNEVTHLLYSQLMGKRKNQTQKKVSFKPLPKIKKQRGSKDELKSLNYFSTSNIITCEKSRNSTISKNVKRRLRKISNAGKQENDKRLQSALNILSENQIVCSAMNIPSIQNMLISKKDLASFADFEVKCSHSEVSFINSMSYLVIQSEPELMLSYIFLVEKALQKLGISLSHKQNEKLLKGVWNLVVKFWSDDQEQNQYPDLSSKIEWGLLNLLNFDLKVSQKERIVMQSKINSLSLLQE